MSKDWKSHKAEFFQLYTVEGRTLQDVKGILEDRHGFIASTRAYRMRVDEWGLRKYKSTKNHVPQKMRKTDHAKPHIVDLTTPPPDVVHPSYTDIDFPDGTSIPEGPIKASELRSLVPGNWPYTLEVFLIKWQDDGEYLKTILDVIATGQHSEFILRRTVAIQPGNNLFRILQYKVAIHDQAVLSKALLNSVSFPGWNNNAIWSNELFVALRTNEWKDTRRIMRNPEIHRAIGSKVVDYALGIIGARLLDGYKIRLQVHDDFFGLIHDKPTIVDARAYLDIMYDLERKGLTVDPVYYRLSLRLLPLTGLHLPSFGAAFQYEHQVDLHGQPKGTLAQNPMRKSPTAWQEVERVFT
ncbi:Clr5 domain-containing protein [Amylocarpus encephaloides]|uniref:Clr5 domain-containing protein n=1 Tax=Amylocarpus encephaloides TaxID=45428 RepID=A0A9P8C8R6_9HELO|nr:Clr5 domain-containing protein [Amylocarpus encephaloides]